MIVARTRVVDEYAEDGEAVVLLADGQVIALSPLASSVLGELAEGPQTLETLAARLVAEYGAPPGDADAVDTTRGVVDELAAQGLLVSSP